MRKVIHDPLLVTALQNNGYACARVWQDWFNVDIKSKHGQPIVLAEADPIVVAGTQIMWLHDFLINYYQDPHEREKFMQTWSSVLPGLKKDKEQQ